MIDFYLKEALIKKFIRFAAVGFTGLLVDYSITAFSEGNPAHPQICCQCHGIYCSSHLQLLP